MTFAIENKEFTINLSLLCSTLSKINSHNAKIDYCNLIYKRHVINKILNLQTFVGYFHAQTKFKLIFDIIYRALILTFIFGNIILHLINIYFTFN